MYYLPTEFGCHSIHTRGVKEVEYLAPPAARLKDEKKAQAE